MLQKKIGFLGAGNMAGSLIRGLLACGQSAQALFVYDTNEDVCEAWRAQGVGVASSAAVLLETVDILVLAVKPFVAEAVLSELQQADKKETTVWVSIMAGITVAQMERCLKASVPLVRVMPNTPVAQRIGVSGVYANAHTSDVQMQDVCALFETVGEVYTVEAESALDWVTALSGSGPAYVYFFMECLQKAAMAHGVPEDIAHAMTVQTGMGAMHMAKTDSSLEALRAQVTSKGGTTEAALNVFQSSAFQDIVQEAFHAAYERSKALGA